METLTRILWFLNLYKKAFKLWRTLWVDPCMKLENCFIRLDKNYLILSYYKNFLIMSQVNKNCKPMDKLTSAISNIWRSKVRRPSEFAGIVGVGSMMTVWRSRSLYYRVRSSGRRVVCTASTSDPSILRFIARMTVILKENIPFYF